MTALGHINKPNSETAPVKLRAVHYEDTRSNYIKISGKHSQELLINTDPFEKVVTFKDSEGSEAKVSVQSESYQLMMHYVAQYFQEDSSDKPQLFWERQVKTLNQIFDLKTGPVLLKAVPKPGLSKVKGLY